MIAKKILIPCCAIFFSACGVFPSSANFANERDNAQNIDTIHNGLIAFIPKSNCNAAINIDYLNKTTGKIYRFSLTPEFSNHINFNIGPWTAASKTISKNLLNDSLAFYELPAGEYIKKFCYAGEGRTQRSFACDAASFTVQTNTITNFGTLNMEIEQGLLSFDLRAASQSQNIDQIIKSIDEPKIAAMKIVPGELNILSH